MAFQYKRRSAEDIEKRAQPSSDFKGFIKDEFGVWKPKKGNNFIRVLPPTWEDAHHYGLDVFGHYGVGPDRASVLCPTKMFNKPCPLCEDLRKAEKAQDEDLINELRPRKQVVLWIVDRDEEKKGPQIWVCGKRMDEDIAKLARDPRSGEIFYLDDPNDGYDISFERTGEALQTRYVAMQLARRPSSIDQDWLDYIDLDENRLPNVLVHRNYDEIRELYMGAAEPGERDRRDDRGSDRNDDRERGRDDRGSDRDADRRSDTKSDGDGQSRRFQPRGSAARDDRGSAQDQRDTRSEIGKAIDDSIPFERDPPNGRDDARGGDTRRDDRGGNRREDPPPATSGRSRAEELKAKFGRK